MVIYYKCKNAENKELGTMEMHKSYIYQHEDEIVKKTPTGAILIWQRPTCLATCCKTPRNGNLFSCLRLFQSEPFPFGTRAKALLFQVPKRNSLRLHSLSAIVSPSSSKVSLSSFKRACLLWFTRMFSRMYSTSSSS